MTELEPEQKLWDEFLAQWKIERLEQMTLGEYTSQGTNDSFCYWLESGTEKLGSIWGGSAFKFGVYARKHTIDKSDGGGRCYNEAFGWLAKYGDTPEEAFWAVREQIVKVAKAAREGDLRAVRKANLGEAIRWKIAFLYQDRDNLNILPIFKYAILKALTEQHRFDPILAHQNLLAAQEGRPMFEYARSLYAQAKSFMTRDLTKEQAKAYFDESPDYQPLKPATKYIAGYESLGGRQIALDLRNGTVTLYFCAGSWLEKIRDEVCSLEEYAPSKTRSSNLAANAPDLKLGNAIVHLCVESLDALEHVCAAYEEELESLTSSIQMTQEQGPTMSIPLNQILYGPPGTGKTYATVELAVQIAEPGRYQALTQTSNGMERRKAIKALYDDLVTSHRIGFTTFHQSFSYEDFIEGIRARTSNDNKHLEYEVEDGVFKAIADRARKAVAVPKELGLSESPTIWKISVGRTPEKAMRDRYINAGQARIGWNGTGDLAQDFDDRTKDEQQYWESLTSRNHSAIESFSEKMQVGDVLLCLKSEETVQAVGVVTSDYYFVEAAANVGGEYAHVREVNWLLTDIDLNVLPINDGFRLVQQAVYPLSRISWHALTSELERQGFGLPLPTNPESQEGATPNYVMIIDEINRGNIARILGELITLLETDKREGGADERSVTLPYSKTTFVVPANLYVIGTMNTADKSLTQLDLALRRRFDFVESMPDPVLLEGVVVHGVSVAELLAVVNSRIEVLLDRDHLIGHSYFLPLTEENVDREAALASVFQNKIIPLLQEYFFLDWERIGWVLNDLEKAWEHRFVQPLHEHGSLNGLFSSKVVEGLRDRRYRINPSAFEKPESYQGILTSNGA